MSIAALYQLVSTVRLGLLNGCDKGKPKPGSSFDTMRRHKQNTTGMEDYIPTHAQIQRHRRRVLW